MKKVKFDVFGMTCSSCQSHVEKAVNKIDDVKKVNVNLLSNEMLVEFDETKIDEKRIIKAVIDAGYNAKVKTNKERKDFDTNIKNMKKRLILSFVFLIPLMYVAMHQMFNSMFNIPVFKVISDYLSGYGYNTSEQLSIDEIIKIIRKALSNIKC